MPHNIHKNARTTPKVRQEIQSSADSNTELARRFDIDIATVRKWRSRDFITDAPVKQKKTRFSFSPWQEFYIIQLRSYLYLGLDDVLTLTNKYIKPNTSRSAISRLLKKHHSSKMQNILPIPDDKTHGDHLKVSPCGTMQVTIIPKLSVGNKYLILAYEHCSRYLFSHFVSKRQITPWLTKCINNSPLVIQNLLLDKLVITLADQIEPAIKKLQISYTICTIVRPEIAVPQQANLALDPSCLETLTQAFNHHTPLHALGNITPFAQCLALHQSAVPSNAIPIDIITRKDQQNSMITLRIKKYIDVMFATSYDSPIEQLHINKSENIHGKGRKMANANETVTELMGTEGAIAAIIADSDSGLVLAAKSNGFDTDTAAAGNTRVMQAKRDTMKMLKLNDNIQDILITLGTQTHLITPLPNNDAIFGYLVVDKNGANLGMARAQLKNAMAALAI